MAIPQKIVPEKWDLCFEDEKSTPHYPYTGDIRAIDSAIETY